jgi:hypothetical protein
MPSLSQPWPWARFGCPGPPQGLPAHQNAPATLKTPLRPKRRPWGGLGQPIGIGGSISHDCRTIGVLALRSACQDGPSRRLGGAASASLRRRRQLYHAIVRDVASVSGEPYITGGKAWPAAIQRILRDATGRLKQV